MEILNLYPGGFASNSYLVVEGSDAVLIDCSARVQSVENALAIRGATLKAILLTHGHYDHFLNREELTRTFHVPLYLHEQDAAFPETGLLNAYHVFYGVEKSFPPADCLFCEGDALCFGDISVQATHTPGHTPGCVVYRIGNALFTGDTLMACGYGRTTFPGGNTRAMRDSLQKLFSFDGQLTIYPGHGEGTLLQTALHNIFR